MSVTQRITLMLKLLKCLFFMYKHYIDLGVHHRCTQNVLKILERVNIILSEEKI